MKNIFNFSADGKFITFCRKIRDNFNFERRPLLLCFVTGTLLYSLIEILGRHSFESFTDFLINGSFAFIYNALIVILTLTFSLFTRRRVFTVALISSCWLILGITNCILLIFRTTPFNVSDFRIILDAFGLVGHYLKPWHFALILSGFLGITGLLALLWRRSKKTPRSWFRASGSVSAIALCLFVLTNIGTDSAALSEDFNNLSEAYIESGFVYGFARTVLDRGIEMPEDYSADELRELYSSLNTGEQLTSPDVNVILIQLESVFDIGRVNNLYVSEDPMPFYSKLKDSYSSGLLTVPQIGSGTANTEFEILTGMTTDCFGAAEYPYYTVLGDNRCESLAYILRSNGYSAMAMHNNDGSFYDRDTVYEKLGFESYTSLECMKDIEYNAIHWAEDKGLSGTITDALDLTVGRDFIFAVTVASHGQYPDDIAPDGDITIGGIDDESIAAKYAFYVNELRKVDEFIEELIGLLESRDEKTVVVMYGDHIPSIELDESDFIHGDIHMTEYVIWDNFGLETVNRDLYAYQLSAAVLDILGIDGGLVSGLNRKYLDGDFNDDAEYMNLLTTVQYDMLYGDRVCMEFETLTPPTDFHMSIYPITVTNAEYVVSDDADIGDKVYVYGSNFTPFSRVMIDGSDYDTEFVSDGMLCVGDVMLFDLDCEVSVGQFNENGVMLSQKAAVGLTVE